MSACIVKKRLLAVKVKFLLIQQQKTPFRVSFVIGGEAEIGFAASSVIGFADRHTHVWLDLLVILIKIYFYFFCLQILSSVTRFHHLVAESYRFLTRWETSFLAVKNAVTGIFYPRTLFPEFKSLSPHSITKNTLSGVFRYWRRGRDSNSGWDRSHDGFQDRCIKPLCHLSVFQLEALATVVSETSFQRRFWPPRNPGGLSRQPSSLTLRLQDRSN